MATTKKRLALALTDPQYDVLSRLARLQGRSRASVVVELVETSLPVLERVVVVGEAWEQSQTQAREGLQASVSAAEAEILPIAEKALSQFDLFLRGLQGQEGPERRNGRGARARAAGARTGARPKPRGGLTPVPVTTGVRSGRKGGRS